MLISKLKNRELGRNLATSVESLYTNHSKRMNRIDERYNSNHIHVSSMIQDLYCPLKQLYAQETAVEAKLERLDLGLQYIWGIGKTLEGINQELTIENLGPDRIVGKYTCLCGKHSYTGIMLPEDSTPTCRSCNTKINRYQELRLQLGLLNGSPDMIACYDNGKFTVTEYKSIKRDSFSCLTQPEQKHAFQALVYVEMLKILTSRNPDIFDHLGIPNSCLNYDSAVVVYTCKDYLGSYTSPVKVFEVSVDKFSTHDSLAYGKLLKAIYQYIDADKLEDLLPDGGLCGDFSDTSLADVYNNCEFFEHCKVRKCKTP